MTAAALLPAFPAWAYRWTLAVVLFAACKWLAAALKAMLGGLLGWRLA